MLLPVGVTYYQPIFCCEGWRAFFWLLWGYKNIIMTEKVNIEAHPIFVFMYCQIGASQYMVVGPCWHEENKVFGYIIVYFTVLYLIVLYNTILCKLGYIGVC